MPVCGFRPSARRCSATLAAVRCSWLDSSGFWWKSRRQATTLACSARAAAATSGRCVAWAWTVSAQSAKGRIARRRMDHSGTESADATVKVRAGPCGIWPHARGATAAVRVRCAGMGGTLARMGRRECCGYLSRRGLGQGGIMKHLYAAALAVACSMAQAAPPTLDDLLRRPQYESMSLSPSGEYVATRVPLDDRTVLAIVRRADMKVTASVDPGHEGFVDSSFWVSDTRLYAEWSMRLGNRAQPYSMGELYSIDVDGRNRRSLYGSVIDPLRNDQEHVLIVSCVKVLKDECITRLRKMRTDGRGTPEDIVDGAAPGATFLADRMGAPHFSWATDNDDIQKVFMRRGDAWVAINDEAESGVEVIPVGVSYDRRFGYLWSERKSGPDVIERIDLATGERSIVASDPQFSPAGLVWSFDGSEPIGAAYGVGVPVIRFFDDKHPHAVLMRDLERTFAGEIARVTSTSRDGRTALVTVTGDREPGRFYQLDTTTGDLKMLARSRPWLDRESLSEMRPISLRARDGTALHGYLTLPKSGNAAAPLVVFPHGGPFGVEDDWGFHDDVQMLAARGYAVLQITISVAPAAAVAISWSPATASGAASCRTTSPTRPAGRWRRPGSIRSACACGARVMAATPP